MKIHKEGVAGFIACKKNKEDGQIDCKCPGFDEYSLFRKACLEFYRGYEKPGDVQSHVIARYGGIRYISTGTDPNEAFERPHKYRVSDSFYEYTVTQAAARFKTQSKITALDKNIKIYFDSVNIG